MIVDKLAALWPFLGICAEVAILCSIIFVYERRKSISQCDEPETDLPSDKYVFFICVKFIKYLHAMHQNFK